MKPVRLFPSAVLCGWMIFVCYFFFSGIFEKYTHSGTSQLRLRSQGVFTSRSPERKGLNHSLKSSNHESLNESSIPHNIVDVRVDISKFQAVDTTTCKATMSDVEVAPAYSMPLIALASFPRSGNTWSRSLIQIATKYSTGSVHWKSERKNALKEWFKAGAEDYQLRKGVCVKTHFYTPDHIEVFDDGAILLLRNPYYSLVSEFLRFFNRVKNVSTTEIIQNMRHGDERWQTFLPTYAKKWRDTAVNWITHCKRLMIVFYEDLESSPVHELTRMVRFLGQPIQPRRIQCALHLYAPMEGKKNHSSHMTFDPYTEEMHGIVDGYIAEVNQTLIERKATPLPVYDKYLLPK